MTDVEMADAEVRQQIERADRFIADFREMVAATAVDAASACADYQRRGLQRIADTLDAVPYGMRALCCGAECAVGPENTGYCHP